MTSGTIEILLVEDNPADIQLAREALEESKLYCRLHVVTDGEAAIDFVHRRGKYRDMPRPDLVLLDLNLPKKDGREVLQEIKADERIRSIPVVVLTMSEADEDTMKAYQAGANCFITKPIAFDQFVKVVRSIEEFWFTIVKLPQKQGG